MADTTPQRLPGGQEDLERSNEPLTPERIAKMIAERIKPDEIIESVNAVGGYVNFKIRPEVLFPAVIESVKEFCRDKTPNTLKIEVAEEVKMKDGLA